MPNETNFGHQPAGIAMVVRDAMQLDALFKAGLRLARARDEMLEVLVFTDSGEQPDWFNIAADASEDEYRCYFIIREQATGQIDAWLDAHQPNIMVFTYDLVESHGRYILDKQLDTLLAKIKCPIALVRSNTSLILSPDEAARTLVPFSSDANSLFAIKTALELSPTVELFVVGTGPAPADEADREALKDMFLQSLGEYADHPRVTPRMLLGDNAIKRLIKGSDSYDSVLLGASRGNTFVRAMLGDHIGVGINQAGQRILRETDLPYVILREYQGWLGSRLALAISHGEELLPEVSESERIDIYKEVRRAARPQIDFFVMIALSAAIASFGLILNSAAVIIGAMLIAPLMSAIIGMGLAMVQGDPRFLFISAAASARGALVVVGVGILVGWLDYAGGPTHEMLIRSGPSLFDLGVATLSGAAAAYALCRKGVSAALPGVAISVALVPPLASFGLFVSYAEWVAAYGAMLLFITNAAAISFSCGIVFTLVGFRPAQNGDQSLSRILTFRRSFFVLALVILGISTNLTYLSIDRQHQLSNYEQVKDEIEHYLENDIQRDIVLLDVKIDSNQPELDDILTTVSSTRSITEQEVAMLAGRLAEIRGKPVRLSVIMASLLQGQSPPTREE